MKNNQIISGPNNHLSASGFNLRRLFFVLAFVALGCGQAVGQERSEKKPAAFPEMTLPSSDNADANTTSSKMELVIWFMGSKQSTPVTSDQDQSPTLGKKSFINLGMKPNRTLIKSFLKKAVNYDNTLV